MSDVVERLAALRIVPVLTASDADEAEHACQALLAGGLVGRRDHVSHRCCGRGDSARLRDRRSPRRGGHGPVAGAARPGAGRRRALRRRAGDERRGRRGRAKRRRPVRPGCRDAVRDRACSFARVPRAEGVPCLGRRRPRVPEGGRPCLPGRPLRADRWHQPREPRVLPRGSVGARLRRHVDLRAEAPRRAAVRRDRAAGAGGGRAGAVAVAA